MVYASRGALFRAVSCGAQVPSVPRIRPSGAKQRLFSARRIHDGSVNTQRRFVVTSAVASGSADAKAGRTFDEAGQSSHEARMQDLVAFLREELPNIFHTGKVSSARYSPEIEFVDPITRATNLNQYSFMVGALATVFQNKFELFDIAITGPEMITARWSLEMRFKLLPILPWTPTAAFTGTTEYTIDPYNGLIRRHVDKWDSIQDNQNLSLEGLRYTLLSFAQPTSTPNLETPSYTILYRTADFEVRDYPSFLVAETPMPAGSGAASGSGFQELAGYIFGGNQGSQNMEMTTPVFNKPPVGTSEPGKMQFVIERRFPGPESLPKPKEGTQVESKVEDGGIIAAYTFSGWPLDTEVVSAEKKLRSKLLSAQLTPKESYVLARYNDPFTPPFLRRNEVLIQLEGFELPELQQPGSTGPAMASVEGSDIE